MEIAIAKRADTPADPGPGPRGKMNAAEMPKYTITRNSTKGAVLRISPNAWTIENPTYKSPNLSAKTRSDFAGAACNARKFTKIEVWENFPGLPDRN